MCIILILMNVLSTRPLCFWWNPSSGSCSLWSSRHGERPMVVTESLQPSSAIFARYGSRTKSFPHDITSYYPSSSNISPITTTKMRNDLTPLPQQQDDEYSFLVIINSDHCHLGRLQCHCSSPNYEASFVIVRLRTSPTAHSPHA